MTNLNIYWPSNTWSLATFTNGMANWSWKDGTSNGVARITVFYSNSVPYIYQLKP